MNKKLVFEHYSRLLDELIDEHDYFKYYFQDPTTQFFKSPRENGLRIRCGIFRGCLISDNCDYVVKFPLSETGEECCEREESIYDDALVDGLENFFVEPVYLGLYKKEITYYSSCEIDEYYSDCDYDEKFYEKSVDSFKDELEQYRITIRVPLFAYPKAMPFSRDYENASEDVKKYVSSSSSVLRNEGASDEVACAFVADYGVEKFEELSLFLQQEEVDDLHRNNIGVLNGKTVIIDYAGCI